jgi:hypothetical protein
MSIWSFNGWSSDKLIYLEVSGQAFFPNHQPAPSDASPLETPLDSLLIDNPYHPAENLAEWEFMKSVANPSGSAPETEKRTIELIDLINLLGEQSGVENLSPFLNKQEIISKIESLDGAGLEWESVEFRATLDNPQVSLDYEEKPYILYCRNIIAVVQHLMANPDFINSIDYSPKPSYNSSGDRVYSEMSTGKWWEEIQLKLPEGATVAALICGSDKTLLSVMKGELFFRMLCDGAEYHVR